MFTTRAVLVSVFLCLGTSCVHCKLWPKGIVHYNINSKDYDLHSQDAIMAAFRRIEREICVKFFNTPINNSTNVYNKILYISNPEKLKDCPSKNYDYSKSIVDVTIGYKCINDKDIARIVVDLLRTSISTDPFKIDSVKKYQANKKQDPSRPSLLAPDDRNLINAYYHTECSSLDLPGAPVGSARRAEITNPVTTWDFYKNLIWPYGIIMYDVDPSLNDTPEYALLKYAMTTIESWSCVWFQRIVYHDQILVPKNLLWFGKDGADEPALGFTKGNQTINLWKMTHGAPGHNAHVLNNLMRALGVPMMSNRHDRDSYVTINWALVEKGKEYLLERMPHEAWMKFFPYDFTSVTHAPANYMCSNCALGAQTVQPQQDHLWQRTTSIGHTSDLSQTDVFILQLLYSKECLNRLGR